MSRLAFTKVLSTISLLLVFTAPAFALDWKIKNLGTLPGATYSTGDAINDLGQVAGSTDADAFYDPERGLTWGNWAFISGPNGGPLQKVDTGPERNFFFDFTVSQINNSGQVVGSLRQGSSARYAYSTGPNGGPLQNFYTYHDGNAINNNGIAVYRRWTTGVYAVQPDGTMVEVVDSGVGGYVRGINDEGQIAVQIRNHREWEGIYPTGAVWSEETGLRDITVNGQNTNLFDINNAGQVLGQVLNQDSEIFVLNEDGTFSILSLPGELILEEVPGGIFRMPRFNDFGQIVGRLLGEDGTSFSFLASITTNEIINLSMEQELIDAGWSNIMVSDINNLGQISGTGTINGTTRAFLLTPVPEPETYAMMLVGLSMLGFMRRRRHPAINNPREERS